jgi:hypothetical protein
MPTPHHYFASTIVEKDAIGMITACRGGARMRRMIQLGSVLLLWPLVTPPAFADAFRVDMVCASSVGIGKGQGKINGQATAKLQVQGLPANEPFTCAVDCTVEGDAVEQSCTSTARGTVNVTFAEKVYTCLGTVFTVRQEETVLCASGFATQLPIPPHP